LYLLRDVDVAKNVTATVIFEGYAARKKINLCLCLEARVAPPLIEMA
jgi:hypothetical protein